MTQIYSNPLKFFASPCPQHGCHVVYFLVFFKKKIECQILPFSDKLVSRLSGGKEHGWKRPKDSFGFFLRPTPGSLHVFPRPYVYSVPDCVRVTYTPTPSPCPRSSLSIALRSLGFCNSTSKRLTTSSAESMYTNHGNSCMMLNPVQRFFWNSFRRTEKKKRKKWRIEKIKERRQ
jgi:hypothetical protein